MCAVYEAEGYQNVSTVYMWLGDGLDSMESHRADPASANIAGYGVASTIEV